MGRGDRRNSPKTKRKNNRRKKMARIKARRDSK